MFGNSFRNFDDPAAEAASLILRLGIAILSIGVPCAAVLSRRLLFVLMPVGAALVVIGGLLSPEGRGRLDHLRTMTLSPIVLVTLFLVFWAGLSLVWTPFAGPAVERFLKSAGTVLVAAVAIVALPERVKASNSNLLPIGVAAAALAIACVGLIAPFAQRAGEDNGANLQRAMIGVVVLAWPALGALVLRHRIAAAGGIAVAVALASVIVWMPNAIAALIVAMLTFSMAYSSPVLAGRALALASAVIILAAPVFPVLVQPMLPARLDPEGAFVIFPVWAQVVKLDGLRLITGHGFDSAVRALESGYLPPATPRGVLFEVWYELGLLGAAGLATLAWHSFRAAGRAAGPIAPFLLAALSCILTVGVAGVSVAQLWWVTLLAIVAICFAIVMRGHQRDHHVQARAITGQRPVL